eukprot:CAMPEP_0201487334 /NCGR_PEP_ID=MMETSP0151_2-20130828/12356_1 /ASSEMBLY_ACC=CAM_ASM_000257 /TAXON_ID=200890 /ORGANISM="Paramoeba atlantica, Strain 621/1 / CCAP 1560/9" /LENGTH=268 /DNA_ID=CAMNT_0047872337 /DNA_START=31 /DNA_END=837 /DNA_ORIENTATION=+
MDGAVWKFGYGSNISRSNLETKKTLKVMDYDVGVLKGYKLYFFEAIEFVEPAFATLAEGNESDEVHGSVFQIPKEDALRLDKQEPSYLIAKKKIVTYGGREIEAEVYLPKSLKAAALPSQRYLNLMIRGADEGGLKEDYVGRLRKHPFYVPLKETLERREKLPKPETLQQFTAEELKEKKEYVSIMGFVLEAPKDKFVFDSWKGRDVTHRNLLHFQGKSLDVLDVGGIYPKVSELEEVEREYLRQNLDRYTQVDGTIKGALKEFWEAQ